MPPIRPKPAEGGWWAVVQDLKDGNFALETISFGLFKVITGTNSSPPFRIILCGSNYEIARAWTKEEALQDWGWAQAKYEEEVHLVGSTKFSDHHFLALFEALWQHDHPEDAPQDTKKEAVFCPELFDALQQNKRAVAAKLISSKGPGILHSPNRLGELPLHFCVSHGNVDLTRFLLSKGADLNAKDKTGWTPLHIACHSGDLRMCEFLLRQEGIGVMVISCDNTLPLHYLVSHSFEAEEAQLRSVLAMMVANGASVNSQTAQGTTPLMRASIKRNLIGVLFLLSHGADINLCDKTGETALHYAVRSGDKKVVSMLVDRGINIHLSGDQGTAREVAMRMNRHDLVKIMDVGLMMNPTASGFASPSMAPRVSTEVEDLTASTGDDEDEEQSDSDGEGSRGRRKTLSEINRRAIEDLSQLAVASSPGHRARSPSVGSCIEAYGLANAKQLREPVIEPKLEDSNLKPIVFELDQPAHLFRLTRYSKLTSCDYCKGYIISIVAKDNYMCDVCGYVVHKKCRKFALFTCKCEDRPDREFYNIEHHPPHTNPLNMSAPAKPARDELKMAYSVQMDLPARINESRKRESVSDEYPIHRTMRPTAPQASSLANHMQPSASDHIGRRRMPSPPSEFSFPRNHPLPSLPPVAKSGITASNSSSLITAALQSLSPRSQPARQVLASLHEELTVDSVRHDSPRSRIIKQGDGDGDDNEQPAVTAQDVTTTTTTTATIVQSASPGANMRLQASGNWINRTPQDDIRRREARFTRRLTEIGVRMSLSTDGSSIGIGRRKKKAKKKKPLRFATAELEKIFDQFNEIDVNQVGIINQAQLGGSLGVLMSTPGVTGLLFNAFDPEKTNRVDIKMYVTGMGVMMKGPLDEGLEYAFKMIDVDGNEYIDRFELQLLVDAVYRAMEAVDIKLPDDSKTFADKIILLMADVSGKITLQQYKSCVSKNTLFFQSLGLIFDTDTEFEFLKTLSSRPKKELSITFGHKDWSMVQNMMLGIRRSVSETTALPAREVTSRDSELAVEYKLAHEPGTPPWIFKDYCPMVFRKIRETFDCDARLYMFCLGPEKILGNALFLGNLCALCEVVSTARSGSFFFKSNDGRFFIKTLPPDEFLFLQRILPSYYEYIASNPNTLLTRFYGMYSMRQGKNSEINFVVMENVFHPEVPIDEQYDLKGSTIDRLVAVEEGKFNPSIALKDMNFKRQLKIGGSLKALLMEQVEKDTRWMANLNICDYSFLVGIHSLASDDSMVVQSPATRRKLNTDPSAFKSFMGGVLSADGEEIYYIAIIDILTQYVFKKKGERLLKSFIHDADQISAMPPKPYQLRFQKYVNSIVA